MLCFMNLAASRHWCPTGSRLAKSGAQKCKNWCPTGSRRDPDWIHRVARTHSRTYFSLPRPTLAPIFLFRAPAVHQYPPLLHQNGKSSLKPNGGSTMTTLHYITIHYITLHYITLHYTALYYNYNCTTTLHYITLHYTTLPSTTLDYITLHYTTLQLQLHNYTPLHSYTKLH